MDNSNCTVKNIPQCPQPQGSDVDAQFLGWQKLGRGEVVALYVVTAEGHPSCGSTVSGRTLDKLNLRFSDVPLPEGAVKKV